MRSKTFALLGILSVTVLLLAFRSASAQSLVSANVLSSQGPVEIRRTSPGGGGPIVRVDFKVDDALRAGDTIVTHSGGRLVLGLSDGSQAIIGEKTTVEIENLNGSPRTIFNVLRGKTRVMIEKVGGRPNPYRVNTPTAIIAVRGTVFDVIVKPDETQVFTHEGQVEVISLAALDKPVLLTAGHKTRVRLGELPEQPQPFKHGSNDGMFRPSPMNGPNGMASGQNDPGMMGGSNGGTSQGSNGQMGGMGGSKGGGGRRP